MKACGSGCSRNNQIEGKRMTELKDAFEAIGAKLSVVPGSDRFVIDIQETADAEQFQLTLPSSRFISAEVLDVHPVRQHLVLEVIGGRVPTTTRYLCGHDERHWFVAGVPISRHTMNVRGAMEALKPAKVVREQRRAGVRHRRHRRHTAAYVRQGEWFFLPRPKMHVGELAQRDGMLVRENGKPHRVEWIYEPAGTTDRFVRGVISHPDHETIRLQVWHRVVENNEVRTVDPAPDTFAWMDYLD